MLLSTNRGTEAINNIQAAFVKAGEDVRIMRRTQKNEKTVTFHIRGMDADATREETDEGIKKILGDTSGNTKGIGGLWPNINNTQAATISLGKAQAYKMT